MKRVAFYFLLSAGLLETSPAAPITYMIDFTSSFGTLPTSGSFTYDAATGFSDFIVHWDGLTFNLTAAANAPDLAGSTGCNLRASTPQYGFIIMDQIATGCDVSYTWGASSTAPGAAFEFQLFKATGADFIFVSTDNASNGAAGDGTWRLISVPEPTTIGAFLFGMVAIAGLMNHRRYSGRGIRKSKARVLSPRLYKC